MGIKCFSINSELKLTAITLSVIHPEAQYPGIFIYYVVKAASTPSLLARAGMPSIQLFCVYVIPQLI